MWTEGWESEWWWWVVVVLAELRADHAAAAL